MKHNNQKYILVFLTICMVFSGCRKSDWSTDPPPAEKIAATNKVRSELGIRQIKENWIFYGRRSGNEGWKDENGNSCKDVMYDKNYEKILSEADYYYSGRLFPTPDPDTFLDTSLVDENLQIVYDYRIKRFGIVVATDNEDIQSMEDKLSDTTPDNVAINGFMGRTNKDTLEVADKILKMWGLERL
ncbi:MAG: hypothetical protein WBC22_14150 [Sedimentisphaerales bacterium]